MHKVKSLIIDLLFLFIITAPAFLRILNNQYFSIHDDQHLARLFLLDQAIRQGYLYPRWVDGLGFGFGYPLYNFYPPLIYYVGELFHLLGFSFIWSIKLVFIFGFYLGASGIYLFVKKITSRLSGLLSATLYTYFFYHAVLIYVRGALAEFFSLAILPFVFLTLHNLKEKTDLKRAIPFGIALTLLILTHPLIALPTFIFIGFYFIFYLFQVQKKREFIKYVIFGGLLGLSLSAFFWLPSMVERKFTLTDKILTGELASYKLHYIYPQQFIYSPWGYGGSGVGLSDGMTFQLGKIHIGLVIGTFILSLIYVFLSSLRGATEERGGNLKLSRLLHFVRNAESLKSFFFLIFLLLFSLFMTTNYSSFIWDNVSYLWYLQFPWRFLTFTAIFISISGGYSVYFLFNLLNKKIAENDWSKVFRLSRGYLSLPRCYGLLICAISIFTIITYQKYFIPQRYIKTSDKERTSFEEISWRISRTSYEFVPKDVKTKKSELNTTLLTIEKKDLPKKHYEIISGAGIVQILKNKFQEKEFRIDAKSPLVFRLNTFNFPGWKAYKNNELINIDDDNDFKLMIVNLPTGTSTIKFVFENTPVRSIGNLLSIITFGFVFLFLFKKFKEVD